ncbi:unnamed protein product [Euphydryas editha]|uniref:Histone-lysine N-methyltransferase SETMAR n=1 Tax=Euphydryas editha TaxID=104508 RepID=A0AAU9V1R8_EUPED|nr:unnamed protein product [Euphydryas editha]
MPLRTRVFLEESGVETLPHPPYSPDLVLCDFFLFPIIKEKIKCTEEATAAYKVAISYLSDQDYQKYFNSWFRRIELCIENEGEYFEKM